MRPWKRTVFWPPWPVKERLPARTNRAHLLALRFLLLGATHFPLTLRPGLRIRKSSLTGTTRLSENLILVPTGGRLCFFEICTSLGPRRQVLGLTVTGPTIGKGGRVIRPTRFASSVNHRVRFGPGVMYSGSPPTLSPGVVPPVNSVTTPAGVIRPIRPGS